MDGFEYCGNHSYCVNNDDDTRGLTCECNSGYTAHRIFFGKAVSKLSHILYVSWIFLNMCYVQGVGIWTSVLKVEKTVERTQIASTLMAAITVSAKLDLEEIHVSFLDV